MHAQHAAVAAVLQRYKYLRRHLAEIERRYKEMERNAESIEPGPRKVRAAAKLARLLRIRSVCQLFFKH
jgi:hypothetical protein